MRIIRVLPLMLLLIAIFPLRSACADEPTPQIEGLDFTEQGIWLRTSEGRYRLGKIETTPAHSRLCHWGSQADSKQWLARGQVTREELAFLMHEDGENAVGGGFYVSKDSFDSNSYGSDLVVVTPPEDLRTLYLDNFGIDIRQKMRAIGWKNLHIRLQRAGIQAIRYTPTWMKLIDPNAVSIVVPPMKEERYRSVYFGANHDVDWWLSQEESKPIEDGAYVAEHYPWLHHLLNDQMLTDVQKAALWQSLRGRFDAFVSHRSPLASRLKDTLHPEIVGRIRSEFETHRDSLHEVFEHPDGRFVILKHAASARVAPSEILGEGRGLTETFAHGEVPPGDLPTLRNDYGKKLAQALEFMKLDDLLAGMARGEAAPWTRNDLPGQKPLLDRWQLAYYENPVNPLDRLHRIHRIFTEELLSSVRQSPLTVPDFVVVNAHQKSALEENPFLVSEFRSDPQGKNGETWLARYEYPSARTYRRFEPYLSPGLRHKLASAESAGVLANPDTDEFRSLTRDVIGELTEKVLTERGDSEDDAITRYQLMDSIHPFTRYNDETLLAFFKRWWIHPIFLRDRERIPFYTPADMIEESVTGEKQLRRILGDFALEEAKNLVAPRYFDALAPWQVALEREKVSDPTAFLAEAKARYRAPPTSVQISACVRAAVGMPQE